MLNKSQIKELMHELMPNTELDADGLPSAKLLPNPMLAEALVRPILFSTPMVEAICKGIKTQTRRIVKPQPNGSDVSKIGGTKNYSIFKPGDCFQIKPKYNVGDVLWVREKWRHNDIPTGFRFHHYADDTIYTNRDNEKWKPSLFMPKEACRIWLLVTDVKIEKLNSISPDDAEKEGIEHLGGDIWKDYLNKKCFPEFMQGSVFTRTESFKSLWVKINGQENWDSNPYVWVVTFKETDCPKGFC